VIAYVFLCMQMQVFELKAGLPHNIWAFLYIWDDHKNSLCNMIPALHH